MRQENPHRTGQGTRSSRYPAYHVGGELDKSQTQAAVALEVKRRGEPSATVAPASGC